MYTVISAPMGTLEVDGDKQSVEMTVTLVGAAQLPFVGAAITLTEVSEPPLRVEVPSLNVDPSRRFPVRAREFMDFTPVKEPPVRVATLSVRVGDVTEPEVDSELDPRDTTPVVEVKVPPFKDMLDGMRANKCEI